MERSHLTQLWDKYESYWGESETVSKFRELSAGDERIADRDCFPAHLTASAVVVTPDFSKVLLTHHRKLKKWLQLGGHTDGSFDLAETALRETVEESGLEKVKIFSWKTDDDRPILDLDSHYIPEGKEPAHWHYDVRYIVVAEEPDKITVSEESIDLKWFTREEAAELCQDTSVVRLMRKLDDLAQKALQ